MMGFIQSIALAAAAFAAAASVRTPSPFPVNPPQPTRGAHCADGGGRAIGDAIGKGAYIRQELQLASIEANRHVVGYVYSGSDGNQYIDLTPTVKGEHVRLLKAGDLPRPDAIMRYCFADAWTRAWGQTR
ncbi:MAG TPA: hypothetical protein VFL13_07105 [Candidatus Baltobacteraceae bacterium]|nr:hypothetical protein [Candidatus Baltobacteraceae bacterium]